MEWGPKENFQEHRTSSEKTEVRPPQPTTTEARRDFVTATTGDATWHQRNEIDTELTKGAERDHNLRRVIRKTRGGSGSEPTTRRAAAIR
ncbi:hypothetical protein EVAR_17039_1 [Eumeta japonica]|uniref:Uncharacterized protein n=1 Tax=Eumeta variegata TaxID=151549 RepID=A0A4C1V4H6_EUMVA|nr:hypothetical protein EVAR_17039_1 [Eumeta japonica]